jgi:hypothetical protein
MWGKFVWQIRAGDRNIGRRQIGAWHTRLGLGRLVRRVRDGHCDGSSKLISGAVTLSVARPSGWHERHSIHGRSSDG